MITLYGMTDSGNCYKPRLLMALTGRPFRHVEVSAHDGTTRSAEWLAKNPNGQVPLMELEDGRLLPESDAMLCYLGAGTVFDRSEPFERAAMLRWMFFEQNSHEGAVAVRRALTVYPSRRAAATPERMALTLASGTSALTVMDTHLGREPFFGGNTPSLADIALYPYTATAEEGGFDLEPLGKLRAWLMRIESLPGFRPKTWLPET
ncbi:glutathione S-transferase family protein [Aurantimonas sp. VKM B-3413]|uniref:glutathione S-transferase family protein n=1 Tax=Aurantimonas sp. VKM B-3413 TaxID=2779401 RepID=UPI001E3AADAE|nr:glutathione S-transferase family protein [Aurantimonas sp. VKM B-3413]MCB8836516.1 glutathione S-transferase family protein [Aurantimonas sp. VKM B-3413]